VSEGARGGIQRMTQHGGITASEPPLFVDLDGTLVKGDLLLESLLVLLKADPLAILLVPFWLLGGRANLKEKIAQRVDIDPRALVYDDRLLERLRAEWDQGRRLVLATASHSKHAHSVARHVGLFEAVLATDERSNLKGHRKLEAIVAYAGGGKFDYIGNESADLEIWRHARKAVVIGAPRSVMRAARQFCEPEEITRERRDWFALLLRAVRVHQWLKNLLVFVPLVAAHKIGDVNADIAAVAAFFAYSLCASSSYLLNDLLDLQSDRLHERKRMRPFASGDMSLAHGLILMPLLLGASIAIAITMLPPLFLTVLATYYVCTLGYSFWAKNRVVWDVIVLGGLYVLRVLAGAAAIGIETSFWLLAFSMFIFLSLALVKRYSEMYAILQQGRHQAPGRGYVTADLPVLQSMGVASGYLSVLVMALYINSPEVHEHYTRPYMLWGIGPLLLFWISRVWVKTHRGQMQEDPVVFAARDKLSYVIALLCAALLVTGTL